jgi:hypothetical protein
MKIPTETLEEFLSKIESGTPIYKMVARDECGHVGVEIHALVNHYNNTMFVFAQNIYEPEFSATLLENKEAKSEA